MGWDEDDTRRRQTPEVLRREDRNAQLPGRPVSTVASVV